MKRTSLVAAALACASLPCFAEDLLEVYRDGKIIAYRERVYVLTQYLQKYGQTWKRTNVAYIVPGYASMYRSRALELYRALGRAVETEIDEPNADAGLLSFELAARVDFGTERKQELLELQSEPERLSVVSKLLERLPTYEHDGALFVRSTDFGDEKDRVLIRSAERGGLPTYEAADIALGIAEELDVVGLLAVELFVTTDGRVLVNELAPRPHNTYHASERACATSHTTTAARQLSSAPWRCASTT